MIAFAVFFGSFLLFGIQPMMGRMLLPPFGGTAAVWTSCLVAYQILLFSGYLYAHGISRLKAKTQRLCHVGLLVASAMWTLAFVLFQQPIRGMLGSGTAPSLEVVLAVSLIIGLPYVMLASGSTLMQAWLSTERRSGHGRGVYHLYAVSNLGSFIGLFLHPLVLEPHVALPWQWRGFSVAMSAYALLVGCVAKRHRGEGAGGQAEPEDSMHAAIPAKRLTSPVLWFALPCLSSFFLVAATNQFTLDITPMPLTWAVVLGLFLLSYAAGFTTPGERLLPLWMMLSAAGLAAMVFSTMASAGRSPMQVLLATMRFGLPSFFFILLFIHSWLYSIRPAGTALTRFYLGNAAGGAVGGMLAGVIAPIVFRTVAEYPVALVSIAMLTGWFVFEYWHPKMGNGLNQVAILACLSVPVGLYYGTQAEEGARRVYQGRDFYGVVSVKSRGQVNELLHGSTRHGVQIATSEESRKLPTTYFGETGGGLAIAKHPKSISGEPIRFGCVGLGIGVMAAYGRPGDLYRFFEISPEVVKVAGNPEWFTFLRDSPARVEIVEADARKALEREQTEDAPKYDILVVDAFSGDSIPMHLITDEAFDLYRSRLAGGGILAVHISNWQFDLFPLCKAQMKRMGMHCVATIGNGDYAKATEMAYWALFTENPLAPGAANRQIQVVDWTQVRDRPPVADGRGSLLPYLMPFSPLAKDLK